MLRGEGMRLTRVAGECKDDDCPTVFTTDKDTIAIQGYTVNRITPEGEAVVEIPTSLFLEAARALGY
jgi:hypothetical protein